MRCVALRKSLNPDLHCVKIRAQFISWHEVSYYKIEIFKTAVLLKDVLIYIFHKLI